MSTLPTQRVILRAAGTVCVINVADFDPQLHAEIPEVSAPPVIPEPAPAEPEVVAADPSEPVISSMSASHARELISGVASLEKLDAYLADEQNNARYPGGRSGVLAAIADRRVALSKE